MTPLTLQLKSPIPNGLRLNLHGLTPCRVRNLSKREISDLQVEDGVGMSPLADWFRIVEGTREMLVLEGDCSQCDAIGGGLQSGSMEVLGSAGDFVAQGMTAGTLLIRGNVGNFAGSGLSGGQLTVEGNAGQYAAGAVPGKSFGMRGGRMVVHGHAQRWAAARMRRGTLIVHGQVADGLAMRMIAGSVVCCGQVSPLLGCGMRRGSLWMIGPQPNWMDAPLPGFTAFCWQELSFLPIFLAALRSSLPQDLRRQLPTALSKLPRRARQAIGDRCVGGLGEILRWNW